MLRQEKSDKVTELKKLFEDAGAYFITDYQGLNVADITVLRRSLRESNVRYLVAKNTLFRIAAKDTNQPDIAKYFTGPTAVAFAADDPTVAAKVLYESHKERELPRFKAFVVENRIHTPEEVKVLAELPPREILLSQVVAAIEAPLTQLVGSLDGFFRELVGSIDALADKRKAEA